MNEITFKTIGFIRTPFKNVDGAPVQPGRGVGIKGEIELIGISIVKLVKIKGNILTIENVDMLDMTPIARHQAIFS